MTLSKDMQEGVIGVRGFGCALKRAGGAETWTRRYSCCKVENGGEVLAQG